MENHPIPQDVTGFQFKLIDSMTIKQFGYVGSGVIMAVVFYYAPFPWYIKFLLVPLFGFSGVVLAFLPIDGRPMDLMAANFFRSIIRPNQYVYHKQGGSLSFTGLRLEAVQPTPQLSTKNAAASSQATSPYSSQKNEKLRAYLNSVSEQGNGVYDQKENEYLSSLFQNAQPATTQYPPVNAPLSPQSNTQAMNPPQPYPQPVVSYVPSQSQFVQPSVPVASPQAVIQQPVTVSSINQTPIQSPVSVAPIPSAPQSVGVTSTFVSSQPLQIQTPAVIQPMPFETTVASLEKNHTPENVHQVVQSVAPVVSPVPQQAASATHMPGLPAMPDFPNLVTGMVRDSRGNVLGGILIEVKNKEGESVRAFKTNPLGQFASATQLANGSYTIELEDPKAQHTFEKIHVEANGGIIAPIVVTSIDAREELRRSLFG